MPYEPATIPPWAVPENVSPKKKPTERQIRHALRVLAAAYANSDERSLLLAFRQDGIALLQGHFIKHRHVNLS
jgi:hypothetical protein